MRPIDKGTQPYESIKDYRDALPDLEKRIGLYCSYCEYPIKHVPEVEHKVTKSLGGSRTDWRNLLLGCKYCNTRKGTKVAPENVDDYLWPDCYNTAIAFVYSDGVPKVNTAVLEQLDSGEQYIKKAQNLFDIIDLGNVPKTKKDDKR